MDGLTVSDADLTVYIHPSMTNKVRYAILRQLSSLLFTYDEVFEGVVLAYEIKVEEEKAKILPGLIPHVGVQVKAKLLVFSPKPDMLVEGKVVKLGKESIHVIVLGFSSAAIMLEDIRKEFKYKTKNGAGRYVSSSNKRHTIVVGSIIRFLVKSFDEEMLHISGSLDPPHTGCIRWLSKYDADESHSRSLKRKREGETEMKSYGQDGELNSKGLSPYSVSSINKSKKRVKRED